ncbi:MAG: hypothetical protein ACYC4R_13780 [Anaerolineae bacterium]
MRTLNYRPGDAFVGDVIPFFWKGRYHAFYLRATVAGTTDSLDWAHAVSDDLVTWEELPVAVTRGGPGAPDQDGIWTGSVIERNGMFHLFYTGWSRDAQVPQTVCHAASSDLIRWEKDPANPLLVPDARWYDTQDWRDPFVFWNQADAAYWMLITSRRSDSAWARRGCVALAKSPDLTHWEVQPPLWQGELVYAPECTDLFHDDSEWTLLYSTMETRCRRAPTLAGPWSAPRVESADGSGFYAAKTLFDGQRRILLGWVALHKEERDSAPIAWGGHLGLPRELYFAADGDLATRPVEEAVRAFGTEVLTAADVVDLATESTSWNPCDRAVCADAIEGGQFLRLADLPDACLISGRVRIDRDAASAGLLLRMNDAGDAGYSLMVEPGRQRVALRTWLGWGDPAPLMDRPLRIVPRMWVSFQVFVQGTILEAFVDDRVALTCRLYDRRSGWLGLLAQNGVVEFADLNVRTLA